MIADAIEAIRHETHYPVRKVSLTHHAFERAFGSRKEGLTNRTTFEIHLEHPEKEDPIIAVEAALRSRGISVIPAGAGAFHLSKGSGISPQMAVRRAKGVKRPTVIVELSAFISPPQFRRIMSELHANLARQPPT